MKIMRVKVRKQLLRWMSLSAFVLTLIICSNGVLAASGAAFTMSPSQSVVKKGQKVAVTITVKSSEKIAGVQSQISYDPKLLSYDGGSANGTDGSLTLLDWDSSGISAKTSHSYRLEFTAVGTGTAKVTASDTIVIDEQANEMSVNITNAEIQIQRTENVSANNRLSSLRVAGMVLSPAFSPNVQSYTVQAGDADELIISALADDDRAVVTISGNENLKPGSNRVIITVTAQSGSRRRYEIIAEKNASATPDAASNNGDNADDNGVQEEQDVEDAGDAVTEDATDQSIDTEEAVPDENAENAESAEEKGLSFPVVLAAGTAGVLCVLGGVFYYFNRKK